MAFFACREKEGNDPKPRGNRRRRPAKARTVPRLERLEDRTLLDAGGLDTLFGEQGAVLSLLGTSQDHARTVLVQPDSKVVVAGTVLAGEHGEFAVARFHANGTPDAGFGTGGTTRVFLTSFDVAEEAALQADGKILVVGTAWSSTQTGADFAIVRLNADGSLDTSFGTGGKVVTDLGGSDEARGVAIQADGRILVTGSTTAAWPRAFATIRCLADGRLDTSFGSGGVVTTAFGPEGEDWADAVAVQGDGSIVVGGTARLSAAGADAMALARYRPDGALDLTFGSGGMATAGGSGSSVTGLAVQADGRIVVAGNQNSNDRMVVKRFLADSSADTSFAAGGEFVTTAGNHAYALALQVDGKILAAGDASSTEGSQRDFVVVRLTSAGALDASFGTGGVVRTDLGGISNTAYGLGLTSEGRVVAAGVADLGSPEPGNRDIRFALTRHLQDGTRDETFGANGHVVAAPLVTLYPEPQDLAVGADGSVYVVSTVRNLHNSDVALTRFDPQGRRSYKIVDDITGNRSFDRAAAVAVQADGKMLVVGTSHRNLFVARYRTDRVALDGDYGVGGLATVAEYDAKAAVLLPDGRLLVAADQTSGFTPLTFGLLRFTPDGRLDVGFGSGGIAGKIVGTNFTAVRDVAVQADGKAVVTGFANDTANGPLYAYLARFNPDGSLDTSFGTGGIVRQAGAAGERVAVQPDGKLILGVGSRIYRYNPDGSPDIGFGSEGQLTVGNAWDVAVGEDGKLVVGSGPAVITVGSPPAFVLRRYLPDGSPDTHFGDGGMVHTTVGEASFGIGLAIRGGRIVVAGTAYDPYEAGATGGIGLARYHRYHPASGFDLATATSADPGQPQDITITVRDAFGDVVGDFTGTIRFTSSDPLATLPADYAFTLADAGMHAFPAGLTLRTPGTQTVTVSAGSLSSTVSITVNPRTVSWDGEAGDFNWNNALNWSGDRLPGAGDAVVIDLGTNDFTVEHSGGTTTIYNFTSRAGLRLSGGSLTVATASIIDGAFSLAGATLRSATAAEVTAFGQLVLSAGTLDSVRLVIPQDSTARWEGTVRLQNGAVLENHGALQSRGTSLLDGGIAGKVVNRGSILKSAGPERAWIRVDFKNHGSVEIQGGVFVLGDGGPHLASTRTTSTGSLTATAGSFVGLVGSLEFTAGSTFDVDGVEHWYSTSTFAGLYRARRTDVVHANATFTGAVDLADSILNSEISHGTFDFRAATPISPLRFRDSFIYGTLYTAHDVQFAGRTTLLALWYSGGNIIVDPGVTLNLRGTVHLAEGKTLTNEVGGEVELGYGPHLHGPGIVINRGRMRKTGSGTAYFRGSFVNAPDAELLVEAGAVHFDRTADVSGTVRAVPEAALILRGTSFVLNPDGLLTTGSLYAETLVRAAGRVEISRFLYGSGGDATFTGEVKVDGIDIDTQFGGTLDFRAATLLAPLTFNRVNLNGTLRAAAPLRIEGEFTSPGGTVETAGDVTVRGTSALGHGVPLIFAGSGTVHFLADATLSYVHFNQPVDFARNLTIGLVNLADGVTLTNPAGQTVTLPNGWITGAGSFVNEGLVVKTGTSTSQISAAFTNAAGAEVRVLAGGLNLYGGSSAGAVVGENGTLVRFLGGPFTFTAGSSLDADWLRIDGGVIDFHGLARVRRLIEMYTGQLTFRGPTDVAGIDLYVAPGTLDFTAATLLRPLSFRDFHFDRFISDADVMVTRSISAFHAGGILAGAGTVYLEPGVSSILGGSVLTLNRPLVNRSTGVAIYSGVDMAPGVTITNEADAILEFPYVIANYFNRPDTRLVNHGTVRVSAGTNTINSFLENDGDVLVEGGRLELRGGGRSTGAIVARPGTLVRLLAAAVPLPTVPLTLAGGATVRVEGAALELAAPLRVVLGTASPQILGSGGGEVALGGELTLGLEAGFTPQLGQVFPLVSGAALDGTFFGLPEGATLALCGNVFRISYAGGDVTLTAVAVNHAPTADAGGPYALAEGQSLALDASGSSDPDGDPLSYTWDVNGDGVFGDATSETPTLSWSQLQTLGIDDGPRNLTVRVRVGDGHDCHTTEASAPLVLDNTAPAAGFANTGPILEAGSVVVAFGTPVDPSAADTAAGFRYSIALDPDDLAGDYDSAGDTASREFTFTDNGRYAVYGRIFDKDNGFRDYVTEVVVANAPPGVRAGDDVTLDEGSQLDRLGSFFDPGLNDGPWTATVDYGDGGGEQPLELNPDGTFRLSHRYDDGPALRTVVVRVTDKDLATGVASFRVTVNTVAPAAAVSDPLDGFRGVRGQERTLTLPVADPSAADQAAGFTFIIDWGDGTPVEEVFGSSGRSVSHAFAREGSYTVTVTARDKDGAVSAPASRQLDILVAEVQAGTLVVAGTPGDDAFAFTLRADGGVDASAPGLPATAFYPAGQVSVWGYGGHNSATITGSAYADDIVVGQAYVRAGSLAGGIATTAFAFTGVDGYAVHGDGGDDRFRVDGAACATLLDGGVGGDTFAFGAGASVAGRVAGGAGINTLDYRAWSAGVRVNLALGTASGTVGVAEIQNADGGAGDDILVGNGAANRLWGHGGRDVLIGGSGADDLNGGNGEDILIGGRTLHDANAAALEAVMAEWGRTDLSYQARLDHLTARDTRTPRNNGSVFLNADTVIEDLAADRLAGGADLDWFFGDWDPKGKDKKASKGLDVFLDDGGPLAEETVFVIKK